ncbi:bifunctional DNA-binding transcriptional regulator/O6-methylguanine-DNA methyltransferase Ada [Herbaspirillum sp. RV1423]|uniref:bifunctional DNA-binding transcriptional regulator/O6-methylguanine-DNA methyltransferase Ada n=1 Tax=Herbaspirillum sp. RV1423 TaxID=1443993 RepID=UPI0009DEFD02|nr:bifunctional DNA-binding transcriptional regulator/O6-methylguanine-DNA methyltransferase Ada [Herbaspirillum sp. RV1423]
MSSMNTRNASSSEAVSKASASPDDLRWQAVTQRDKTADGAFYYAVRTTGVYCRPSCPSRQARRENVAFFDTGMQAEHAGFRPCKRCKPNEAALAERQAQVIAAACRAIEQAEELPSLDELAQIAGMSRFHFHRVFKEKTGVTPKAYAAAHRARRLREELAQRGTVTDAMYEAGFNSSGRFYAESGGRLGMTPSAWRAGGSGAQIHFAVAQCWLGAILVATTQKGVCAITLGDDPDRLVRDLQDQFPQAELVGGDAEFEKLIARVIGFIDAPQGDLNLPLDVRGTAFQQRVWQALRDIPAGTRVTYSDIAERIGKPSAVRAVASACASNAIAVLIPCHRVVRMDGSLSGYRWGVDRKKALLDRESGS